jgi:hypothetical protein
MAVARRRQRKANICITVERDGVWLYGDRPAFQELAKRMSRLARSEPREHHELHVRWHLGSPRAKRKNVFVLMDAPSRRAHRPDFEVTFIVVEPSDLRRLRSRERSGTLPPDWDRSV